MQHPSRSDKTLDKILSKTLRLYSRHLVFGVVTSLSAFYSLAQSAEATCYLCPTIESLYDDVGGPLLERDPPVLDDLSGRSEAGPSVFLTWSNPATLMLPTQVEILRSVTGGELAVIYSCDEPVLGCPLLAYRDSTDLEQGQSYEYQVAISDGVGNGYSNVESISISVDNPSPITASRWDTGAVQLRWHGDPSAAGYRIIRRNALTGSSTTTHIPSPVDTYVDTVTLPGDVVEYEVRPCRALTPQQACDANTLGGIGRLGVGGDSALHGLHERAARHRFRPDALLLDISDPSNPFSPSERLIFRDETTGALVAKLTNDPHKDFHLYSNIPVWNRDGSRLLYHSTHGPHWGWRVMEADGSEIRDIASEALSLSVYSGTAPWWSTRGLGARWSRSDPNLLVYAGEAGEVGELAPASSLGPQQDLGLVWTSPEILTQGLWLSLHPDGTKAVGVHAMQGEPLGDGALGSRAYLIDLDTGTTDVAIELTDDLAATIFAHQLWFTKDVDYALTFNAEGRNGQWRIATPLSTPGQIDLLSGATLRRAGMSPDGSRAGHLVSAAGVGVTEFATTATTQIDFELQGHSSWDVDDDWFVTSHTQSIWRVWLDGHRTQIASPYTKLIYAGETHAGFMPSTSPDGTKIAFKSPMLGNIDLYAAVAKLPDRPENLSLLGSLLQWDPPLHALELASYNVWRTSSSGIDYTHMAEVPASTFSYDVGDTTGYFYRVTAVEHSGIEGHPSNEATHTVGALRRYWLEPHLGLPAAVLGTNRPLVPSYHGASTGLYSVEATSASADLAAAASLDAPTGSWWIWGRTRGGLAGDHFDVYDDAALVGELAADHTDFLWVPLSTGSLTNIAGAPLRLLPSAPNIAIDQMLLTNDAAFVPPTDASLLDITDPPPPGVTGLGASPGDFTCTLDWTDSPALNFSHFNVYSASGAPPSEWTVSRLVASVEQSEFTDWGLEPDQLYFYRVSAVDRQGAESTLTATSCTTHAIVSYHLELLAPDPSGWIVPDSATGAWHFAYDIPPSAAPAEFVAWIRVHSVDGKPLSDTLARTVSGVTADWDLATQLNPIRRSDGSAPEARTPIWAFVSLADSDLHIYRPAALLAGTGEVVITPVGGRPMRDLRVTGFVLTNDLSHLPPGITDYLLPDTRGGLEVIPAGPECDDGRDNDSDGTFDFGHDPGCVDENDGDERSSTECDNGVDDDGDSEIDIADPGCIDPADPWEGTTDFQCDDGADNDFDGNVDLDDPDRTTLVTRYEEIPECDDGVDNDGDGLVDFPADEGCHALADPTEDWDCEDGIDNDGDGDTDFPNDPGCREARWAREDPACSDGVDNDGDGYADFDGGGAEGLPDPECRGLAHRKKEDVATTITNCGIGFELVIFVPMIMGLRTRRRR